MNFRSDPPLTDTADETILRRDRVDPGSDYVAPRGAIETSLSRLMQDVLRVDRVGRDDSFFELGGDSLRTIDLFMRIEKEFDLVLPPSTIIDHPTTAQLAELVARGAEAATRWVVPLQAEGAEPPLFLIHDVTGTLFGYRTLVRRLGTARKVFGLQHPRRDRPMSIPQIATLYVEAIKTVQPEGPYLLAGHSLGGTIAYEVAQQLRAGGDEIGLLASIDGANRRAQMNRTQRFARKLAHQFAAMAEETPSRWAGLWLDAARAEIHRVRSRRTKAGKTAPVLPALIDERLLAAHAEYEPRPYPAPMKLLRCVGGRGTRWKLCHLGWKDVAAGGLEIFDLPTDHETALLDPTAALVAAHLERWIEDALRPPPRSPAHQPSRDARGAGETETHRDGETVSFVIVTESGARHCNHILDVLRSVRTERDEVVVITREDHVADVPYRGEGWFRVVGFPDASVFALRAQTPAVAQNQWIVLLEEHTLITAATLEAARSLMRESADVDLIMFLGKNLTSTDPWGWANFLHTFTLVWAPIDGAPPFSPAPAAIVRHSAVGYSALREGEWELEAIPRLFASGRVAHSNEVYFDHARHLRAMECLVLMFHNARACAALSRRLGRPITAILWEGWHVVAQRPQQLARALKPRMNELPAGTPWRLRAVGLTHMLGCLMGAFFGPGRSAHAID